MNVRAFVNPPNAVRCRTCEPEMDPTAPAPTWFCYLGDTIHLNGSPRSVVVFECAKCGELRYLDLKVAP